MTDNADVEPFGTDSVMVTIEGHSFVMGVHEAESFAADVRQTVEEVFERGR